MNPSSPYKGLMPYAEEDAPFFFGREGEREIITANLMAARLTLLYGASGVGKSSVLRAGVVYHLRATAMQNLLDRGVSESVVVNFASWRDDPMVGLVERVRDSVERVLGPERMDKAPVATPGRLVETLSAWTDYLQGDLLIILDQFEEYFLYHAQEDGDGTFATEFPRAVNRRDLRVSFLISMREDALAKLDRFKGRIPNLFDNYLRIEHLDRAAAQAAIEKPIEAYNHLHADEPPVRIEPELVQAVLDQVRTGRVGLGEARGGVDGDATDVADARIETPYLQLVMTRLWEEERRLGSSVLRLETLRRLGGAERIWRTHLDMAMKQLPRAEQVVAARAFRYLVTPSGTKIAYTLADLANYAQVAPARLDPVLQKLSSSEMRLLRAVAPPGEPHEPRYEIFHDVLAPAILDWRERCDREEQKNRIQQVVGAFAAIALLLICGLGIYALSQTMYAQSLSTSAVNSDATAVRAEQTSSANATLVTVAAQTAAVVSTQVTIRETQVAGLSSALLTPEVPSPPSPVAASSATPTVPSGGPTATGTRGFPLTASPTSQATPTATRPLAVRTPLLPRRDLPGYIFGIVDSGGESLFSNAKKPGWVVMNVAINPPDSSGDYSALANAGFGVIVNLQNTYNEGTLPFSSQYDQFAQQCAAFVAGSKGANIWVVGYETNAAYKRPGNRGGVGGEVITPDLYAQAFAKCRSAIKKLPGHANDWVSPAPPAAWNIETTYPGNPNGDWVKYFQDVLSACIKLGAPPDALALHTYTHGMDVAMITSEDKMGRPYQNNHSQFRAYRDFLSVVPSALQGIPVLITETQAVDPTYWQNRNIGWIQAAYREIDAWNAVPSNQPIQALALYRWQTGDSRVSLADKSALLDDLATALQNNYRVRWPAVQ